MRLQVAVLRRQWIEAVVRQYNSLRVLQFHEHARPKRVVRLHAVELARGERLTRRPGAAREQRDVRALAGFRDGVPRFEPVDSSAQIRCELRGELVAGRQEYLGSKALEQRAPALVAGQRGTERADALR